MSAATLVRSEKVSALALLNSMPKYCRNIGGTRKWYIRKGQTDQCWIHLPNRDHFSRYQEAANMAFFISKYRFLNIATTMKSTRNSNKISVEGSTCQGSSWLGLAYTKATRKSSVALQKYSSMFWTMKCRCLSIIYRGVRSALSNE